MNYGYEILKFEPKSLFLQVRFFSEGKPDIFKNFILDEVINTEQEVRTYIEKQARIIFITWDKIDRAPETVPIETSIIEAVYSPVVEKEHQFENSPKFDYFTEVLEDTITETDTQIIHGFSIRSQTEEEKQITLSNWRDVFRVTMRQARLALAQEGLLGSVNAAITQMTQAEREVVEIEWEYAAQVERGSDLVSTLGAALGLTDEQLDNLFKLAVTL